MVKEKMTSSTEQRQTICTNMTVTQINFNSILSYVAQNHNHIALMGFTICTVHNILCPWSLYWSEVEPYFLHKFLLFHFLCGLSPLCCV